MLPCVKRLAVTLVGAALLGVTAFFVAGYFPVPLVCALIIGGVLEGLGLLLTLADIQLTAQRVKTAVEKVAAAVDVPGSPFGIEFTFPAGQPDTGGPPPTIEEIGKRLDAIEKQYGQLQADLDKAVRKAAAETDRIAEARAREVRDVVMKAVDEIEVLIKGIHLGGLRLRQVGIVLFIIGVGIMTNANIRSLN